MFEVIAVGTQVRDQTPMRILFVVKQTGILRHFEEVLLRLADRGHRVRIASPDDDHVPLPDAFARCSQISKAVCPSERSDQWGEVIGILRGSRSYARYWNPVFDNASKLRMRALRKLASELSSGGTTHLKTRCPRCRAILRNEEMTEVVRAIGRGQASRLHRFAQLVEAGVPSDPAIEKFLKSERPDLLVVTPLVNHQSFQPDYVKSAQALNIPTVAPVFSWDNLSNKGLMHVIPDRVLVWNDVQHREAVELHDVPADRIEITGAPRFDPFLRMIPTLDRMAFCAANDLDPAKPILAYLGSSRFIAPDEMQFVMRWLETLRTCSDTSVATAGIVLRPHPRQKEEWLAADWSRWERVTVSVSDYQNADQQLFNCLYHSAAAVELNTSAALEAALTQTPVFTVRADEFRGGQAGTLHFHYLLEDNGGCVRVADSFDSHTRQLGALLAGDPEAVRDRTAAFVARFVRGGLEGELPTERMVRALETVGGSWLERTRRRLRRRCRRV